MSESDNPRQIVIVGAVADDISRLLLVPSSAELAGGGKLFLKLAERATALQSF